MDNDDQGTPGLEGIIDSLGAEITETSLLPTDSKRSYLFAYDLLLEQATVARHVKKLLPFKVVKLVNHRLAWPFFYPLKNSALPTILRTNQPGDAVWGLIYHATGIPFGKLEHHLRVPDRYHKKQIQVEDRGGRRYQAFAYALNHSRELDLAPSKQYLAQLTLVAEERGLPEEWVNQLRKVEPAPAR